MPRKTKPNPDAPPVGRATVKTDANRDKLCQAIELGATYRLACQYAGIAESVFYEWKAENAEFAEAIQKAEGKGAISHLARIKQASTDGNWQASAWVLERRYPDEYGRRVIDTTVRGDKEAPLRIEVTYADDSANPTETPPEAT